MNKTSIYYDVFHGVLRAPRVAWGPHITMRYQMSAWATLFKYLINYYLFQGFILLIPPLPIICYQVLALPLHIAGCAQRSLFFNL